MWFTWQGWVQYIEESERIEVVTVEMVVRIQEVVNL